MNLIALREQKLREIRSILTGNSGDNRLFQDFLICNNLGLLVLKFGNAFQSLDLSTNHDLDHFLEIHGWLPIESLHRL